MKKRVLLLLSVLLSPVAMAAEDAATVLRQKLTALSSFQAEFRQQVWDASNQLVQQGQGQLLLKQPARFRFETTEPEPNVFIGDGKQLWHYNELLQQVSIYDAETEINQTPFALLISTNTELWQQYEVTRQQDSFIIRALAADSPVQQLTLTFSGPALSQMQLLDMQQQRIIFEFISAQLNVVLEDSLFQFEAGPDIEVDDQRQRSW